MEKLSCMKPVPQAKKSLGAAALSFGSLGQCLLSLNLRPTLHVSRHKYSIIQTISEISCERSFCRWNSSFPWLHQKNEVFLIVLSGIVSRALQVHSCNLYPISRINYRGIVSRYERISSHSIALQTFHQGWSALGVFLNRPSHVWTFKNFLFFSWRHAVSFCSLGSRSPPSSPVIQPHLSHFLASQIMN